MEQNYTMSENWKQTNLRVELFKKLQDWAKSEGIEPEDRKFAPWLNEKLDMALNKTKWVEQFAPHLGFVSTTDTSMIIRDKNLDGKLIEVTYKDNRLWCSECKPKACMHVFFTMGHLYSGKLKDSKKS